MSSVKCVQCGLVNWASAEMCRRCGAELANPGMGASSQWQPAGRARGDLAGPPETFQSGPNVSFNVRAFDSVGSVVSSTIDVIKNNLWLIIRVVLVVFAPYEIVKALSLHEAAFNWQTNIVLFILGIVCRTLAAPALFFALVTTLSTGVAPSLTEAYRWGVSRLGRIVAASILAWILEVLGMICLIVPGIILALAFVPVGPIATLEEHGPVDVLKLSYNLTKGYRWRILGAGFVIGLLCWVLTMPISLVAGLVGMAMHLWLLNAAINMLADIVNASTIVLSLMIYLSLVSRAPEVTEGPLMIPVQNSMPGQD